MINMQINKYLSKNINFARVGFTKTPSDVKVTRQTHRFMSSPPTISPQSASASASPVPPSKLIFLRHGARQDQFDRDWHLTSPTPYDPPLTTKGVTQATLTGTRLKSLLPPTSSRLRIIIHTSPFLRC